MLYCGLIYKLLDAGKWNSVYYITENTDFTDFWNLKFNKSSFLSSLGLYHFEWFARVSVHQKTMPNQ